MRAIVEFGVRGGRHSSHVFTTAKAASAFAARLSWVLGRGPLFDGGQDAVKDDFRVKRDTPRISWQSSTHFVSVSLLDGVPRGADTASWRKGGRMTMDVMSNVTAVLLLALLLAGLAI